MHTMIFFILVIAFVQTSCDQPNTSARDITITVEEGFELSNAESVRMDSVHLTNMTKAIISGEYPNVHSVLIGKDGKLVYEKYFPGKDEILGDPIGLVNQNRDTLHDMRSVTKSFVSACVGIALSQGKIKSVEQKIWDYFPEYGDLNMGDKSNLTIKHLLTMSSGLEWNENIPYTDPANSEIQMDKSADPIRFVLSRNSVHPPGRVWNYNGGTTQVLAAIIKKATGLEADAFATKYLFTPVGITHFSWIKFPDSTAKNVPLAAAGLRLRSRDMLKFGLLYMNKGIWNGQRILPENWVADSHKTHITREDPISGKGGYGYQFWTLKENINNKTIDLVVAVGNGDQRIFFDHANNLLVVTTAGNYNQWTIKNNTAALLTKFIYPSLLTPTK